MQFLAPLAFLFALSIPVVILWYLLKPRRTEWVVSSLFLWRKSLQELTANTPFQRLRRNLLLFLQILLLMFAVAGLARPSCAVRQVAGRSLLIAIDTSASMNTREAGDTSRLELAKTEAIRIVDDMTAADSAMVVSFASRARVWASFTHDKGILRSAVESIRPTQQDTRIQEILLIADSVGEGHLNPEMYLLSDGGIRLDETGLRQPALPVHFVSIGEVSRNLAVVALDVRERFDDPGRYEVFAGLQNFGNEPAQTFVNLYLDDEILDSREIVCEPDSETAVIFNPPPIESGVIRVEIETNDPFPIDDVGWREIGRRRDINVLLVTSGNYFLEKALNVHPHVFIEKLAPSSEAFSGDYDLVVLDGSPPESFVGQAGAYLLFNVAPPGGWLIEQGELEEPVLLDWNRTHPAMKYLNLTGINFVKTKRWHAVSGVIPLAVAELPNTESSGTEPGSSDENPILIAAADRGQQRIVACAFDIYDSDWPLRISFPLFISNCIEWLIPASRGGQAPLVRPGEPLLIEPPPEADQGIVRTPSGREIELVFGEEEGFVKFGDTEELGLYTFEVEGQEPLRYAVNFFSRTESDIRPRGILQFGELEVASDPESIRTNRETWKYFVLVAIAILLLEWHIYTRRAML